MLRTGIRNLGALAYAAVLVLVLAGCSSGVDGTYEDASGATRFELHGGKADVTLLGNKLEGTYKVEGDKVIITYDGEPAEFTRQSDGSLQGAVLTLKKK